MRAAFTWHGGGIAAARAHFGEGPWLDLSTGINPHSYPTDGIAIDWRPLPGRQSVDGLERVAAAAFGCDPALVCALPGTETGLRLVGGMLAGPAFHRAPGYRTHAEMLPGSRPCASLEAADGATLILANPHNPDGRLLGRDAVRALVARRGGGWLILDEAFADCHPQASLAADVGDGRPLMIFRSFGKFFGLAGMRLGFLIAPRAMVAAVRARLGAWPLSAAAIAIGTAAYADGAWISAMRGRLERDAAALDAVLSAAGLNPGGACPLFRLVETPSAPALFDRLARQAILTRPFAEDPRRLRLGLPGSAEALERLASVLGHG